MTTTKTRSRAADAAERDEAQQPQPEQAELPLATGDLGAYSLVLHRPKITLPDGRTVNCPHSRWGHEHPKVAQACLRKVAAEHGVRVEEPTS
ncbi:MAG TPA: hypothetical protein VIV12_03135 [Streptosporangiaceae bacterium]